MEDTKKSKGAPLLLLIESMFIFGTIGIFRRNIPLGSATLAMARGFIGVLTILLIMLIKRKKPDLSAIRKNLALLIISGGFIGINWILLFESYNRTTIAVATLCYYMAPVWAIIGAAFVLKEKLTPIKIGCILVATFGMVGVSGVIGGGVNGEDLAGIFFGLGASVLYACVILMNQKIKGISSYDKTVIQLLCAAIVILPYALIAEDIPKEAINAEVIMLVIWVGVLNTGIAYWLYFASMDRLSAQTVAFFGYIDPVIAIILSVTLLSEPLGIYEMIGIVCIFGATVVSQLADAKAAKAKK